MPDYKKMETWLSKNGDKLKFWRKNRFLPEHILTKWNQSRILLWFLTKSNFAKFDRYIELLKNILFVYAKYPTMIIFSIVLLILILNAGNFIPNSQHIK
jgi:hypothetical protein